MNILTHRPRTLDDGNRNSSAGFGTSGLLTLSRPGDSEELGTEMPAKDGFDSCAVRLASTDFANISRYWEELKGVA
jgi:hypothetical protein